MEEKITTLKNGIVVVHRETIISDVILSLSFWDRVKVLFGSIITIKVFVYCANPEVQIEGSESTVYVNKLFNKKETSLQNKI